MVKKGPSESLIKSAVRSSFTLIKNNKLSFVFLLFTHLAFLIVTASLFTYYSIEIGTSAQEALVPFEESSIGLESLMENSETIHQAYLQMRLNIFKFLVFIFLAYVFLAGLNWNIANLIVNEDQSYIMFQIMFGVSTAIFGVVIVLLTTILSLIFNLVSYQLSMAVNLLGILLILYFTYISFSLIHNRKINPIRTLIKTTLKFGWQRKRTLLYSFCFMILLTSFFGGLIIMLVNAPIYLLVLSLIPFILVLSWGKIFFMLTVKKELETSKLK